MTRNSYLYIPLPVIYVK